MIQFKLNSWVCKKMVLNNFLRKYRFSNIEIKHLLIGTSLFTAVMISFYIYDPASLSNPNTLLEIFLLVILTAPLFFLHEIGHKINAQKFNLWAEFRIDTQGALLTLVSVFLPLKFVAPGAVMIRANDYSEVPAMGKVAGYGPAVNIFLGGIYLIMTGIFALILELTNIDVGLLFTVFFYASGFSFFLGVFNMIPFGPLDGKKVKYWNEQAFWILFGITAALAIETYLADILFQIFPGIVSIGNYFFVGYFVYQANPFLGALYPLVLGIVVLGLGYYLLKQLANPAWEPGKQQIRFDDYRDYHYYDQVPSVKAVKGSSQSSSAPMNAPCAECGRRELLPFRCSTCHKIFCTDHRLPGKHFCVVDADYKR